MEDLLRRKAALEEAITVTEAAATSAEYTQPFVFKMDNNIKESTFDHPTLKMITKQLLERHLGFNPDLALQHIQKEALEQFNAIFTSAIKGMSVPTLMAMQHEIEKFDMYDRLQHHRRQLEMVNEALAKNTVKEETKETPKEEPSKTVKKVTKKK